MSLVIRMLLPVYLCNPSGQLVGLSAWLVGIVQMKKSRRRQCSMPSVGIDSLCIYRHFITVLCAEPSLYLMITTPVAVLPTRCPLVLKRPTSTAIEPSACVPLMPVAS